LNNEPVEGPYEKIYQRIVEGSYLPGQRLIEQRIAEELHVSRTPVREAFRRLETAGLIVAERNRGAVVRAVTRQEVVDLYELRSRLEALAAERAAVRSSEEELSLMEEAVIGFGSAVRLAKTSDQDSVREVAEWNKRFHEQIVTSARHKRLEELLRLTVDAPLVFRSFQRFSHDDYMRSDQFHQLIFNALRAGDAARAGRLMTEHIDQGRDVLLHNLDFASPPGWSDSESHATDPVVLKELA
jgi:DNA-binding GntR family transcriptional regulator